MYFWKFESVKIIRFLVWNRFLPYIFALLLVLRKGCLCLPKLYFVSQQRDSGKKAIAYKKLEGYCIHVLINPPLDRYLIYLSKLPTKNDVFRLGSGKN